MRSDTLHLGRVTPTGRHPVKRAGRNDTPRRPAPLHLPAQKPHLRRRDTPVALDMFSGCGGSSQGIEAAGFEVWYAANHWELAVRIHELNHPGAEHFVADLLEEDADDFYDPSALPACDLLWASPSCFPAGTLVLTKRGLVPIEDVVIGDEAWTHMQRWRPVVDTMTRIADTVILAGNTNRRLEVTGNHGFYARSTIRQHTSREPDPAFPHACDMCGDETPRSKRGEGLAMRYCSKRCGQRYRDLRNGRTLTDPRKIKAEDMAGEWWGTPLGITDVPLPEFPEGIDWWWLGRWVGDGWATDGGDVVICAGNHERDSLRNDLARSPLAWAEGDTRTGVKFTHCDVDLASWLHEHFGKSAHTKRIPTWLLAMPRCDQGRFIEGYASADGHDAEIGYRRTTTVSKELAHGVRLLVANLGFAPSLYFIPSRGKTVIEGREVSQSDQWAVSWYVTQAKERKSRHLNDGRLWAKVDKVEPARRSVQVFNITVDEDHTYVADGIVVFNCTNHSKANSERALLLDVPVTAFEDDEYDEKATSSERSRATAVCVLQYARKHHPLAIVVENVPQFAQWGVQRGKAKRGDGSTFRWWLSQFVAEGYDYQILYLNSRFFGVPQDRNRVYIVMVDSRAEMPDLDFRPPGFCSGCDAEVGCVQTFKRPSDAWCGWDRWGNYGARQQYIYRCERCGVDLEPYSPPAASIIDWSNLGERIGDKNLESNTVERIARAKDRFNDWTPFVVPMKATRGVERLVTSPLPTQTTQREMALVTQGGIVVSAGNTHERDGSTCRVRDLGEVMWTQHTTPAFGMFHHPLMITTSDSESATFVPMLHIKQNGSAGDTAPHAVAEPFGTFTTLDSHALIGHPWIHEYQSQARSVTEPTATQTTHELRALCVPPFSAVDVNDILYRMLTVDEIKRGMGFRWDYAMLGNQRQQVRALGNGVTPGVAVAICERLRPLFA